MLSFHKTCYLKAYFPAEFFSIILTNNSGYWSKMQYIEEARRLGEKIGSS
jgi:DNA polymerase III alpha subunit